MKGRLKKMNERRMICVKDQRLSVDRKARTDCRRTAVTIKNSRLISAACIVPFSVQTDRRKRL